MVASPITGSLRCGRVAAVLCAALFFFPAAAQQRLTLEEVGARKPPDYGPVHSGETVTVRGVVSAPAYHFPGYSLVAISDGRFGALVAALQTPQPDTRLDGLRSGEEIEVIGTVSSIAGGVTIQPQRIAITGQKEPPAPVQVSIQDLQGFRYLGRLVRTKGRVVEIGDTTAGDYTLIAAAATADYRIFFPRTRNQSPLGSPEYRVGDTVQAMIDACASSANACGRPISLAKRFWAPLQPIPFCNASRRTCPVSWGLPGSSYTSITTPPGPWTQWLARRESRFRFP